MDGGWKLEEGGTGDDVREAPGQRTRELANHRKELEFDSTCAVRVLKGQKLKMG